MVAGARRRSAELATAPRDVKERILARPVGRVLERHRGEAPVEVQHFASPVGLAKCCTKSEKPEEEILAQLRDAIPSSGFHVPRLRLFYWFV